MFLIENVILDDLEG